MKSIDERAAEYVADAHREARRLRALHASEDCIRHHCYRVSDSPLPLWQAVRKLLIGHGINPNIGA